jgi:hypothetical protein
LAFDESLDGFEVVGTLDHLGFEFSSVCVVGCDLASENGGVLGIFSLLMSLLCGFGISDETGENVLLSSPSICVLFNSCSEIGKDYTIEGSGEIVFGLFGETLGIGVGGQCTGNIGSEWSCITCTSRAFFGDSGVSIILGLESLGNLTVDESIGVIGSGGNLGGEGIGDECVELGDLGVGCKDSHSEGGDDSLGGSDGGLEVGEEALGSSEIALSGGQLSGGTSCVGVHGIIADGKCCYFGSKFVGFSTEVYINSF